MAEDDDQTTWVAVLLDWQNVYGCAREAFGFAEEGSIKGTVDPLKLARRLASGIDPTTGGARKLQEVRVYRGRPDNNEDRKGYAAWRSQTDAWEKACGELLVPRYRDLRYRGVEVMEKGIDVALAVDLIRIAHERSADRAVVVSSDTDLVPALEVAVEVRGESFVEVAGWVGHRPSAALLSVPGVPQHRLDKTIYEQVRDPTDYNVGVRIRKRQGWDAQIHAEGRQRRS
jgi:uncharacterized LabA/DUF88 family protein